MSENVNGRLAKKTPTNGSSAHEKMLTIIIH
jgi:hypothetical protein